MKRLLSLSCLAALSLAPLGVEASPALAGQDTVVEIVVDGKPAVPVRSAANLGYAVVMTDAKGPANVEDIKPKTFAIELSLGKTPALVWIREFVGGKEAAHDVQLRVSNSSGKMTKQLELPGSSIVEVELPLLGTGSEEPGRFTLRAKPEVFKWAPGTGQRTKAPALSTIPWSPQDFRVTIEGVSSESTNWIRKVSPIVVRKVKGAHDVDPFQISVPMKHADPLLAWAEAALVGDTPKPRKVKIEYLNEAHTKTLMTLEMTVDLVGLSYPDPTVDHPHVVLTVHTDKVVMSGLKLK